MVAARYLKDLYAQYQDWPLTVMAFTCGPANVERARYDWDASREELSDLEEDAPIAE